MILTGTIQEIGETKNYPKKDGSGSVDITKLKIADKYFTCFSKDQLKEIQVGSNVDVTYTEKENEYEGKKYINNNISTIKLHEELSEETKKQIAATQKVMETTGTNATHPEFAQNVQKVLKGENTITVGNKCYKITLEEIN